MTPELLTKLLTTGQSDMNVEERKSAGLWPPVPIKFSTLLDHATKLLSGNSCWREQKWWPQVGESYTGDGDFLRYISNNKFVVRSWDNGRFYDKHFGSFEAALREYLKGFMIGGVRLDGWEIWWDK